MNRVIIINLNGNAYQLEESGYDALRAYLDLAARRLEGNPDQAEILADIEQAIADKFRSVLGVNKTVVIAKEVEGVITEMGPVEGTTPDEVPRPAAAQTEIPKGGTAGTETAKEESDPHAVRRLYRMYPQGAMLSGVCNGLAAYFNVDVTVFRLLFVLVTLLWGAGLVVYVVAVIVIPLAKTPAEKSAAYGAAATAQEFIRRAKEGYYEGMKALPDKQAWRDWKKKAKHDIRAWKRNIRQGVHEHAYQWHESTSPRPWGVGPSFGRGLFWLGNALVSIVAVFALCSLVTHHAVFGVALPAGVPLWIGIVAVIVLWHLVAWPLRGLQWGAYAADGWTRKCPGPLGTFGDFIGGLAFLALVVWLLDRYVPQFHEALKHVPPLLHQMVDAMQRWLEKQ